MGHTSHKSRRTIQSRIVLVATLIAGIAGFILLAGYFAMRAVLGPPCHDSSDLTVDHVRRLAEPIIAQLEARYEQDGKYPLSLSELNGVADPDVGSREWSYSSTGSEFVLLVGCPPDDYPHVRYESRFAAWFVDF
jgi:hypothetical protein